MSNGIFEKHSPGTWRKTARNLRKASDLADAAGSGASQTDGPGAGVGAKGAPLLGDTRDGFRPKTSDIPAKPGVYKWRDENGRVIYVGKAKSLRSRLTNYFQPLYLLHPRTQTMVLTARSLEWTVVATELEALTLEYTWIKEFDPRFNVVFRDDKTYPYLAVSTGEEIPRIWITRNKSRKGTRYYGPYAKVYDMRQSLDSLLKVFPVRTCTPAVLRRAQLSGRPCLLGYIGKCSAPCVGWISLDDHRAKMAEIVSVLTGRAGTKYVKDLTGQMKSASGDLDFERAAKLRDQISMLENVVQQNAIVFSDDVDADVFGLASDELEASVHAFFVRAGTIRGERNWNVERVEDVDDAQLLSDLITQAYSSLVEDAQRQASAPGLTSSLSITTKRNAVALSQSVTTETSVQRAAATRDRKAREELTGRDDLFSEISAVPRQVIVPIEPTDRLRLEQWLSELRGSKVTIHVAQRGEKRQLVDRAISNAQESLKQNKLKRTTDIAARTQALNDIQRELGLEKSPLRIEGYDISNATGGGSQVASMVVFEDGVSKRSEYRRFSIKGSDGKGALDDTSALYETLTRRFRHGNIAGDSGESIENEKQREASGETGLDASQVVQQNTAPRHFAYKPNLIVVDGGKPQVEAAARALTDSGVTDVALCGLAKRLEEVWMPGEEYPLILKRQSEGMYLLQRVRDESHRFAITYHRSKRRKGEFSSVLDSIDGIGPTYGKRLLRQFGSVKKLRAASLEEIRAVKGVGAKKAQLVFAALHPEPGKE